MKPIWSEVGAPPPPSPQICPKSCFYIFIQPHGKVTACILEFTMDNSRFHRWALYFFFYCHAFSFKAFASCYFPNGTDVNAVLPTEVYQPCDAGDEDSMCCALNRPNPDKCRSDGLCLSTYDGNIWRETCTDRSWKSPKCIKLCDSGIGRGTRAHGENFRTLLTVCVIQGQYIEGVDRQLDGFEFTITPCGDGSYCCGNGTDAQSCCDGKKGVFLLNGETTSKNSSGTSSVASGSSTSTSEISISTTLSHASQPPTSSKNNTGAIVGGVIGSIAILALIIGMILILTRTYRHAGSKAKKARSSIAARAVPHEVAGTDARKELDARQMQELEGGRNFHELQ